MPYTNELNIDGPKAEIGKFKAITEEAAITPTVLGNVLDHIVDNQKKAAPAFAVPPNIPYAETLAVTHEAQKVKISYNYRNPQGNDIFMPVWINPASTTTAGVMSASDKDLLDHIAILAQNMDRDDNFELAQRLALWFEDMVAAPFDVVQSLSVSTTADKAKINYNSNGVLVPDQTPDYLSAEIPAATYEMAGVMTAADKVKVDKLSEVVLAKKQLSEIDSLTDQGLYAIRDGSMLLAAVSESTIVGSQKKTTTYTQLRIFEGDARLRYKTRTVDGINVTTGDWSEWRSLRIVMDGHDSLVGMANDVAYMKSVFEKNGW